MSTFAPVSVVMPCYRCAATVARAVGSVAAQTLRPQELILVDDASGDGTVTVLLGLARDYGEWVRVVQLVANAGAASARNAGWNAATQPYIAFLDADDAWHPRKIELQYGYMAQHPDVVLCGHACRQLPAGTLGAPAWNVGAFGVREITWRGLLLRHQFVTPSVMLKRTIALRFATGQRHMEDHRLWLEIVGQGLLTVKLEAQLAAIYKPVYGASGLSANMWGMERAELANYRYFHRQGKYSWIQLNFLQCYSLVKYVRRLLIVSFLPQADKHGK